MKGSRCCFKCDKQLINKRDEVVPCDDRRTCEAYLAQVEAERLIRESIRIEKQLFYDLVITKKYRRRR